MGEDQGEDDAGKRERGAVEELLLVANPSSGRGKAQRWADRVLRALRNEGRPARLVSDLAAEVPPAHAPREPAAPREWWVFGGDGTLNGLVQRVDDPRTRIAIFPTGTGNVVARELGVP